MEAVLENIRERKIRKAANNIIKKIMSDLSNRSGFFAILDVVGNETKEEIEEQWEYIITKELNKITVLGRKQ